MDSSGHSERKFKLIEVKNKNPRKSWTNRTSKITQKFCKKHNQLCDFTENGKTCKLSRREYYENRKVKYKPVDCRIICRICNEEKHSTNFYKDPSRPKGYDNTCKICKKEYDRKRNNTWPVLIKMAYRTSIRAHGNHDEINSISLEECQKLLEDQNKKCNHCRIELTCEQGTVINCNYNRASLDRIDTNIIGYKNNAQWLCVSCNKGKCTMPDKEHKEKFSKLFERIEYLENLLKIQKTASND